MRFADALTQAATVRGPRSTLERLLTVVDDTERAEIEDALRSKLETSHLAKALTLLAREHGLIVGNSAVTTESVKKWREAER